MSTNDDPFHQLFDFIDELRDDNYNIGAGQYLAASELLLKLADKGKLPKTPTELCSLLAPLYCSSPQEQRDFKLRFNEQSHSFKALCKVDLSKWVPDTEPALSPDASPVRQDEIKMPVTEDGKKTVLIQRRFGRLPWLWITVSGLIAAVTYFSGFSTTIFEQVVQIWSDLTQTPPDSSREVKEAIQPPGAKSDSIVEKFLSLLSLRLVLWSGVVLIATFLGWLVVSIVVLRNNLTRHQALGLRGARH